MKKDDKCAYNYLAYQFYLIYFMLRLLKRSLWERRDNG